MRTLLALLAALAAVQVAFAQTRTRRSLRWQLADFANC